MDNITEEIEALRGAVGDLRTFQHQGVPQELDKVHKTLAQIERRLEALEMNAGQVKRTGDVPMWLQTAVQKGLPTLTGKLTATEVAERIDVPTDHATLIRLGRYLQTLGIRRSKSGSSRYFWFIV
jgi:hypothetical protein